MEQIDGAALARLKSKRCMPRLLFFVTIHQYIIIGIESLLRQLVGLVRFYRCADAEFRHIDRSRTCIVQLHPRVWKVVQIVHDAIDI